MDLAIDKLIPQKAPFLFIDKVISFEENSVETNYVVKEENPFVDNGVLFESGLIENMAQSAAALEGCLAQSRKGDIKLGFIGSVKKLSIHKEIKVGDLLETKITIVNNAIGVNIAEGKVECKGALVAECVLNIFLKD